MVAGAAGETAGSPRPPKRLRPIRHWSQGGPRYQKPEWLNGPRASQLVSHGAGRYPSGPGGHGMRKQVLDAPRIGGTYSTTTAHGTKAGGYVFVTGQIANKPGTDPVKRPEQVGELGSVEDQ